MGYKTSIQDGVASAKAKRYSYLQSKVTFSTPTIHQGSMGKCSVDHAKTEDTFPQCKWGFDMDIQKCDAEQICMGNPGGMPNCNFWWKQCRDCGLHHKAQSINDQHNAAVKKEMDDFMESFVLSRIPTWTNISSSMDEISNFKIKEGLV